MREFTDSSELAILKIVSRLNHPIVRALFVTYCHDKTLSVISRAICVNLVIEPRSSVGEKQMTWNDRWAESAACRTAIRPDALFVRGAAQNRAKQLCSQCPVRTECLAEALTNNIEWGVWGGMTERERRALLRRRPNVTSWRRLLETAREQHGSITAVTAVSGVSRSSESTMQSA